MNKKTIIALGVVATALAILISIGIWNKVSNSRSDSVAGSGFKPVVVAVQELTLQGTQIIPINDESQQARVDVTRGKCALVYDSKDRAIGRSCWGKDNVVDGIIHGVSAENEDEPVEVLVSICPFGSPGKNIGSCN